MRVIHAPKERLSVTSPTDDPSPPAEALSTPVTGRSRRGRHLGVALVVLVIGALIAALVVTNLRISNRPDVSSGQVHAIAKQQANSAISELQSQSTAATKAYQTVEAALVLVQAQNPSEPGGGDLGSGVIVDKRGDILTALHVVNGASAIQISFADGSSSSASIASSDPTDDIAVLTPTTPPAEILPAVLGNPPQIGDQAFAVGNPLGLEASLSAGVFSGLNRTFTLANGNTLSGLIQFDAAVNPGSSGGPLLNAKGQVIGIVTGLANPTGSDAFSGIGFAVPIQTAAGAAGAPDK